MFGLGSSFLGTILILVGGLFFVLILIAIRIIPNLKPRHNNLNQAHTPLNSNLPSHQDSILIIQPGGRINYANDTARNQFELWDEMPNLERLARRARPSEIFWQLCAAEGQAQFLINNQRFTGTSYRVPNGTGNNIVLVIRNDQAEKTPQTHRQPLGPIYEILNQLNDAMAADLGLEATMESILTNVEQLIPTDFAEINLINPEDQSFTPYRFVGIPGLDRQIQKAAETYAQGEGYTSHIAQQRAAIMINDVDAQVDISPAIDRRHYPFQSCLGTPLFVGGELIGTLELTSTQKDAYTQDDTETLNLLSGQVGIAIHNSLTYQEEQRRARELASLANLSSAVSSVQDYDELFANLVQGISPLLEIHIAGFLIFDETRRILKARPPFIGVPPQFVDLYQVPIDPDTPAEKVWRAGQVLITRNPSGDQDFIDLGLDHSARAAGLRDIALIPLKSGGRSIGYLQVANKVDKTAFNRADIHLLEIVAGQAAPIIENANLIKQSLSRALRAEALRRIASLSGSDATIDEIFKYSLLELARLLMATQASIFLLDENRGDLASHPASLYGFLPNQFGQLARISISDPNFRQTTTAQKQSRLSNNILEDGAKFPEFSNFNEPIKIRSVIGVPIIIRERGFGEILLTNPQDGFFSDSDVQLAATVANQLAVAYERAQLASETDEDLRRRIDQLTALTRIGRELNTSVELNHLLQLVFDEAKQATHATCGQITLFNTEIESQERQVVIHIGDDSLQWPSPVAESVLQTGKTVVIGRFQNGASELDGAAPHEGIRSALLVPIFYSEQVAGVIELHATQPENFGQDALEIAQALATQAAIAIGNAYRYQDQITRNALLNRRIEILSNLFNLTQNIHLEKPLESALEDIAFGIQTSTPFNTVLISMFDGATNSLQRQAGAGIAVDTFKTLQEKTQPWAEIQNLLRPEFCLGRTYYIPYDRRPNMSENFHAITLLQDTQTEPGEWHPKDILVIPLIKPDGIPLGLISVDQPRDNLRPDMATIETLEIYASQAAIIIENHQQRQRQKLEVAQLSSKLATYQNAYDQYTQLSQEHQANQVLIAEFAQSTRWMNAGFKIVQKINNQSTRENILKTLAQGFIEDLEFDTVLIAEPSSGGPKLIGVFGDFPDTTNPETLLGQKNPLLHNLQSPEILAVADLAHNQTWAESALLFTLNASSFVSMPISKGAGVDSAVLAISYKPQTPFSQTDQRTITLLAQQIAVLINNINLINETGNRLFEVNLLLDFNRRLGSLDPSRILSSLIESALQVSLPAEAGMIATHHKNQARLIPEIAKKYAQTNEIFGVHFQDHNSILAKAFQNNRPIKIDEVNFTEYFALDKDAVLNYRKATGGKFPMSAMIIPIQSGESKLGVLILENFSDYNAFSEEDLALITTLTQQTALTLENARLFQSAEERAAQLQALSTVASSISSSLEPEDLIEGLLASLKDILPFETGTLWLRTGNTLSIRAAQGFDNAADLIGISTTTQDSRLFNEMVQKQEPISVGDIRVDDRFPALTVENLSWLGVPLIAKGELIGIIALEKKEAEFYTTEHIQAANTFGSQAAIALENANLYQQSVQRSTELDERSQRLALLNEFSNQISGELSSASIFEITMAELHQAQPAALISAISWENSRAMLQTETPRQNEAPPLALPDAPIFSRLEQSLGIFTTRDIHTEAELALLAPFFEKRGTQAIILLPIATGSRLHGFFMLHNPDETRISADNIDLVKIITNQAAVALQNANSFAETVRLTEELEQRVESRTAELAKEHQRAQSLLRIMAELSGSLDLDHVLNRTLEVLNETIGAEQSTILLSRPDEKTFYYRASLGYSEAPPRGGRATQLHLDEGLAGWVIQNRESVLLPNVIADQRWIQLTESPNIEHRSAIAAPLIVGAEALGAILLFHRQENNFSEDDKDLIQAAARQMAVAINNTELFNLIRDQSESLGNMLRSQQVESSRSMAILEAVADGVLVTDSHNEITLFNESAHAILALQRSDVLGKSLENFTGLFGRAAQTWMNTIQKWSLDPTSFEFGDSYAEQITMDDNRVVAVHLAPVVMGSEFLGTVSIFRDITHQIEVDRLKSEFVATVSHELRTPMTSIKGYVEILLMGAAGPLSEQQTGFLDIVKNNTERLNILVNDLLDVSRIEAGKVELTIQQLDIESIIQAVIKEQNRLAQDESKPMNFTVTVAPNLPRVAGDEERVRQILANLVSNAYLYTPAGGQIDLQVEQVEHEVQFHIKDNGIGIPPEEQDRIFERFYRGEDPLVLASSGTGLGLSIVQQLIKMHHGRLWLQSSGVYGEGSVFSFSLPLQSAAEDE